MPPLLPKVVCPTATSSGYMSDGAFTSFGVVITGSDTRIRNSVMMCGPQSNSGVADVALVDQKGVMPSSNQCVEIVYLMAAAVLSDKRSSIKTRATLRLDSSHRSHIRNHLNLSPLTAIVGE